MPTVHQRPPSARDIETAELIDQLARVHVLVSVFDGDPNRLMELIGNERLIEPFVEDIKRKLRDEPRFLDRLRIASRDFSALFARTAGTS